MIILQILAISLLLNMILTFFYLRSKSYKCGVNFIFKDIVSESIKSKGKKYFKQLIICVIFILSIIPFYNVFITYILFDLIIFGNNKDGELDTITTGVCKNFLKKY